MKLISKQLDKEGAGSIRLQPEEPADLWHAYNLIHTGNILKASTFRRITKDKDRDLATGGNGAPSSSGSSQRVQLTLAITVQKTDFDPSAGALHASGPVAEESPHVRLGAYHTLDLALHRAFTLSKLPNAPWDSVALQTISSACDPASRAEVGAVVLQPGLANVCLVTEHMTLLRQRVEIAIPRKRAADSAVAHDKAITRFYAAVAVAMQRHFDYGILKVVIIASPGFSGEQLLKYLLDTAGKDVDTGSATAGSNKILIQSKNKFMLVHCASGHIHALNEVLRAPEVLARLADTKFARESATLEKFFCVLNEGDGMGGVRAWYGPKHVATAVDRGAVKTLLISDRLFRSDDVKQRKYYVALVEQVRSQGGEALVFSSLHESGKQLDQFTGIAAILNFPIPELEDMSDDDEHDEMQIEKH
ncbi:hypothetical protein V1520DRAFT_341176 [Lipomyces starkeyi]|uniref:Protein DOM34 homolog n=1 Tax=Lipomyces starkeyi NRRL Y-11557 TaxID=675824 RepID=A0A1E3PYU2_LIPST|nr:hypothetical protein LIPSTDRAFT_5918 [Lipomyces starkeyi NRRL Y-11557]